MSQPEFRDVISDYKIRMEERVQALRDKVARNSKKTRGQRKAVLDAEANLRVAKELALLPPYHGPDLLAGEKRCNVCGWPFGFKHRYADGSTCEALKAYTKLSTGEWIKSPTRGVGLTKFKTAWPAQHYGPMGIGSSSQYGITVVKKRAFVPIVEGETAAVTMARIRLRAAEADIPLDQALADVLKESDPKKGG
jgi:hypothetical protein